MAELRGSSGEAPNHILTRWFGTPDLHRLETYASKAGGYSAMRKALLDMAPADITNEVKTSGLRGRGGAGFATGTKWSFINRDAPGPKYVVVNADESEPGTAKDRYILENSPHMVVEGILIAAYAVGANQAWVYIRGEYDRPYRMLTEAIEEARAKGYIGPKPFGKEYPLDIRLYRGHGAYICGEETALLESLEGKRAQPRSRPPFPAVKGAWGRPTLLNNVETLATVPAIINMGGAAYAKLGTDKSPGTRLLTFYAYESCGKCTPCRIGQDWAVRTYERILANEGSQIELDTLQRVSDGLQNGRCLCGLGDSGGWVIDSTLRHFREEYEDHALRHECNVGKVMANA